MLMFLYAAGLIVCVAAILLTAILCLLKKKAVVPTILFGLCVLLILAVGFAFPDFDPFFQAPAVRERCEVTYDRTGTADAEPLNQEQELDPELEAAPESDPESDPLSLPQDDAEDSASEPAEAEETPEPAPKEEPAKKPSTTRKPSSTPSTSKSTETTTPEPTPEPVPEPTPVPAPEPTTTTDDGPTLMEEPELSPVPNPTVSDEPTLSTITNPTLDGSSSGTEYIHSFSNGVLLATAGSNQYHCKDCQTARKISRANEIWFGSVEEAEAQGYVPCSLCYG